MRKTVYFSDVLEVLCVAEHWKNKRVALGLVYGVEEVDGELFMRISPSTRDGKYLVYSPAGAATEHHPAGDKEDLHTLHPYEEKAVEWLAGVCREEEGL